VVCLNTDIKIYHVSIAFNAYHMMVEKL